MTDKDEGAARAENRKEIALKFFRFEGYKIAEYWDVTQAVPAGVPGAANMF